MSKRTDPLVPILASSVAFVVVGAIVLVFYPRIRDLVGPDRDSVVGMRVSEHAGIPVWVCRSEAGIALLIEPWLDDRAAEALAPSLRGGPHHLLRLSIYNFAGDSVFAFRIPDAGLSSPGGGEPARAVAALLEADLTARQRSVLFGLGAVRSLEVPPGRTGHALLAVGDDPSKRTAFVSGELRFERKLIPRGRLEAWRVRPDYEQFQDF